MKPLIFWRHADMGSADKIKGSDSRSPLPASPVLVSGAPKQSEKLHLHHVFGEQHLHLHLCLITVAEFSFREQLLCITDLSLFVELDNHN